MDASPLQSARLGEWSEDWMSACPLVPSGTRTIFAGVSYGPGDLERDSLVHEHKREFRFSDLRSRDAWEAEKEGMEGRGECHYSFHPVGLLGPGALGSTLSVLAPGGGAHLSFP